MNNEAYSSEINKTKIAAVGDLHIQETDKGKWKNFFQNIDREADVLLIAGDLTHTGDELEAQILAEELSIFTKPVVCVLGNHDYEKSRNKLIRQTLMQHPYIKVLEGECTIINGIGIAGVKGFGGGFDHYMLSMFGESTMKHFVQEAVDEALQLERALARLDQEHNGIPKIALMHYAPVSETVLGEPEVIYPFLGSSRLFEPLFRKQVAAVFHGHAHAGKFNATVRGIPIFNVAKTVLSKEGITKGYYLFEV